MRSLPTVWSRSEVDGKRRRPHLALQNLNGQDRNVVMQVLVTPPRYHRADQRFHALFQRCGLGLDNSRLQAILAKLLLVSIHFLVHPVRTDVEPVSRL